MDLGDYQAKECHGHLHVHIKPEVVIAFETTGVDAVYGKIGQPKQRDLWVRLETNGLKSEISGLKSEINVIKDDLIQKLDAILKLIQNK
ncbi:16813_t:CDS:2 [Rhizophagus irregularis]|nr:16813_t:CDS:2 [Rhizophagus irregularis]